MSIRRLVGTPATSDDGTSPLLAPASDLGDHRTGGSRRQFVRKIGLGSAAAVGAIALPGTVLASAAAAQTASSDEEELSAEDTAMITFLESLEGAAAEVYETALAIPTLLPAETTLLASYHRHHQAHITALGTARAAEDDAATPDAGVVESYNAQIAADTSATAVYEVLYNLESQLAATFLAAIGALSDALAVAVLAGIGPVDGQQAFQLGKDVGKPIDEILPIFQTTDGSFPLPVA